MQQQNSPAVAPSWMRACADCHKLKTIISHGRCNACHLRWRRQQVREYEAAIAKMPVAGKVR